MQAEGGQIVVNPTFQEWVFENDHPTFMTPMKRQITYRVEEEIGPTGTKDVPIQQHDSQGSVGYEKANPTQGSNRAVLILVSLVFLISIAALVLVLLMLYGKIGDGCGCSANEGQY